MTPRFGRPTAYVPPSPADDATPDAIEALDAFLELSPLDAIAADASRHAGASAQTSSTPAHSTASAEQPSSRPTPAPAGDPAPAARFREAPHPAPTTRAEQRITHHLRRDA